MPAKSPFTELEILKLQRYLAAAKNRNDLQSRIVNAPFQFKVETALIFLGIVVLLLADKKNGAINRVALSKTEMAEGTVKVSMKRFEDIKIPLNERENIIAKAIRTKRPQKTSDWKYLFTPELTAEQARLNQAGGSIGFSCVYPLKAGDGGALIFSYFQFEGKLHSGQRRFMRAYTKLVDEQLSRTA